jgi:methionyl-tRNA formyltransferase
MNGDKNTGITVFQIKPQVDTGNILLQKEIKIRDEDNMYSLGMRLCELGADLILKALDGIEGGQIKGKPQDPNLASPAPKITKDLTRINWSWSALKIHNWIRGLSPYPGMYSSINNKKFRIFKTCIEKNTDNIPGEVIQVDESMMKVSTGDGSLSLIDVQIEGKRKMSVAEFLRGADIKVGDQLGL